MTLDEWYQQYEAEIKRHKLENRRLRRLLRDIVQSQTTDDPAPPPRRRGRRHWQQRRLWDN